MDGHIFLVVMCFIAAQAGSSSAETNNFVLAVAICSATVAVAQTPENNQKTKVPDATSCQVKLECHKNEPTVSVRCQFPQDITLPPSKLGFSLYHPPVNSDPTSKEVNVLACRWTNAGTIVQCTPKSSPYKLTTPSTDITDNVTFTVPINSIISNEFFCGMIEKVSVLRPEIHCHIDLTLLSNVTDVCRSVAEVRPEDSTEILAIHRVSDTNKETAVKEHSSLKLICSWNPGKPPKDAQLVKDGVLLIRQQPTTSQMTNQMEFVINDTSCQDGGNYSCEAAGAVKNQSIQVTVHCTATTIETETIYSTQGPTEVASDPWFSSEEIRQTTTMHGESDDDKSFPVDEKQSVFDVNTILYISFGCIAFLMIVIAILCGVVVRRKVSAPTQPPPAPVPDENVTELQQLPAKQGAENRVSILSYASDIYQEIEDSSSDGWPESEFESESQWSTPAAPRVEMTATDAQTKRLILEQMAANNRRRARHCRPPLEEAPPVLPDSANSASAFKLPVVSDCDYFHPTASEKEKAHSSKADCTCFQDDVEGAAGGVCPHMVRLCNPQQQTVGTDTDRRHRRQQRVPSKQAGRSRFRYHDDHGFETEMGPSHGHHTLQPSLGAMSSHTGPPIEGSAHRTLSSISESSIDSDGYMRPRPAVLPPRLLLDSPKRLASPIHRPLMLSDRPQGTLKTSSSSVSNANTASGETGPTRRPSPLKRSDVSGDNTASGETCSTRRPTPSKRSCISCASVKPQPHKGDVVVDTSGGCMRMTRPNTVTSAAQSNSGPQTNVTSMHGPVAYANTDSADNTLSVVTPPLEQGRPNVRKHPPSTKRNDDDHPYQNIDTH